MVNLALHLLNVLLLWWLAWTITRRELAAFFIAAIFAVHPIATDAVTNVGGRPDLMAAAAMLGGLVLYARGGETAGLRWRIVTEPLTVGAPPSRGEPWTAFRVKASVSSGGGQVITAETVRLAKSE